MVYGRVAWRCERRGLVLVHMSGPHLCVKKYKVNFSDRAAEGGVGVGAVRLLSVAAGAAAGKLLEYEAGSAGVGIQTAYGIEVEVRVHNRMTWGFFIYL